MWLLCYSFSLYIQLKEEDITEIRNLLACNYNWGGKKIKPYALLIRTPAQARE